jgi:perosamine synthetase
MTTAKIPWWAPEIGPHEYDAVRGVLESNYVNEGAVAEEFESRIAALVGARYGVAVTSGTAAIAVALMGLGVGQGDEVLVPDVTFIATANAVRLTGAEPVLCDIDTDTLNLCPLAAERAITPRTKAVVPVHVSGRSAAMPEILALAKRHALLVVEDAAEAFLSKSPGGAFLGTLGDAGCFSFSPNKTITTGQGGVIVTNDEKLNVRLRELKDHGRPVRGTGGDDIHASLGYNFKFTNLQAAIGVAQLNYLDVRLERMTKIYLQYEAELSGLPGVRLPGFRTATGERPLWTDAVIDDRDALEAHLRSRNIHSRKFWFPLHTQAPYLRSGKDFPNSSSTCPRALWLPSAFTLTDEDVARVCSEIKAFYNDKASPVTQEVCV